MVAEPVWDVPRSTASSRHVLDAAAAHGLDPAVCLAGTGLTVDRLDDPAAEVQAAQELAIIRNTIARLGDIPGLGAETGARYNLADTGILGYAIMASPTLRDAIEVARRYIPLSAVFLTVSTELTDTELAFVFDDASIPLDVRQFLLERDLAAALRIASAVLGRRQPAVTARLELRGVKLPSHLLYDGDVSFAVENNAVRNAVVFPAGIAMQPMPAADGQTAAICIRQCEELLDRRRKRRGVSATVRSRLIRDPSRIPTMGAVATELSTTERTLHRRLAAEKTSYRALLDEVRATLAAELLIAGFTVEETAHRLGYSETAAFTRAHIRWSGHAPSRRKRLGPDESHQR